MRAGSQRTALCVTRYNAFSHFQYNKRPIFCQVAENAKQGSPHRAPMKLSLAKIDNLDIWAYNYIVYPTSPAFAKVHR